MRAAIVLWLLPLAFFALLTAMLNTRPMDNTLDSHHLIRGLLLWEGSAPFEPSLFGTPGQVLVGAVLRLMHPFTSMTDTIALVGAWPKKHLLVVGPIVYCLVGLALFVLGRSFLRLTGSLWPALLAQSAPFLPMAAPQFVLQPTSAPVMIIAVCWLLAATLKAAMAENLADHHGVLLGSGLGFGIALSPSFAALAVVPLLLLDRRRLLLIYPAATLVAFFVFVAPSLPSYSFSPDEGWGPSSPPDIRDPRPFPLLLIQIFASNIIISTPLMAMLVVLMAYVRMRRRGIMAANPLARLAVGLILAQVMTVALTAMNAPPTTLIPAVLLTGPVLAALWHVTAQATAPANHRRAWRLIALVLATLCLLTAWKQSWEL